MRLKQPLHLLTLGGVLALSFVSVQCGDGSQGPSVRSAQPAAVNPAADSRNEAAALPEEYAGEIFGVPVPLGNYYFAKRVHSMFQKPEEQGLNPDEKERLIWHHLILSYEASRRGIEVTAEELDQWIDSVLAALELPFTRTKDPASYKDWVEGTLFQGVELFENQMKYLANIEKLKREIVGEMQVSVSEKEMIDDFFNIENHVGGEYRLFDNLEEAEAFYAAHKDEKKWERYKKKNPEEIREFHPITLQAIIDLWGVPREMIYEFHALEPGKVGRPMPFGRKWGVFRLTDKRTGNLERFEERRQEIARRVEGRKQYQARDRWVEEIYDRARVKVWINPETP